MLTRDGRSNKNGSSRALFFLLEQILLEIPLPVNFGKVAAMPGERDQNDTAIILYDIYIYIHIKLICKIAGSTGRSKNLISLSRSDDKTIEPLTKCMRARRFYSNLIRKTVF